MITIVSGLPRSGTSLLMQILLAGGYPVYWDKLPNADACNPKGYYEWAGAKELHVERDAKMRAVDGKCVKIFPYTWFALTPAFDYQHIYIDRSVDDVYASHQRFFRIKGRGFTTKDGLEEIRWHALIYLRSFRALILRHQEIQDEKPIEAIDWFLEPTYGKRTCKQLEQMKTCVDHSLIHF